MYGASTSVDHDLCRRGTPIRVVENFGRKDGVWKSWQIIFMLFIGSVWEEMKKVSDILELPNGVIPIVLLCFGFPNEAPPKRPRWPLAAVLHEDTYRMPTRQEMKEYYEEANQKLLKMKYFDENIHSWAEHWQEKLQLEEMKKWEEKLCNDLRELGFLP